MKLSLAVAVVGVLAAWFAGVHLMHYRGAGIPIFIVGNFVAVILSAIVLVWRNWEGTGGSSYG